MLTSADLIEIADKANAYGPKIIESVGEGNWFPCGRAYIRVSGKSDLYRLLKKVAVKNAGTSYYTFGPWSMVPAYGGGFDISFRYGGRSSAFTDQSLNFYEPMMEYIAQLFYEKGVKVGVQTWID